MRYDAASVMAVQFARRARSGNCPTARHSCTESSAPARVATAAIAIAAVRSETEKDGTVAHIVNRGHWTSTKRTPRKRPVLELNARHDNEL